MIDHLRMFEKLNNPDFKGIEFDAFFMEKETNESTTP